MGIEDSIRKVVIFDVRLHMDMKGFNLVGNHLNNMRKQFRGMAEGTHRLKAVQSELKRFATVSRDFDELNKVTFGRNSMMSQMGGQIGNDVINNQKNMAVQSKQMGKDLHQVGWNRLRDQSDGFFKVMALGNEKLNGINKNTDGFRTKTGRAANTIRSATHGMRGFKMEMLGVMFFGMGLQKFFTGLLKPALELVGMFELWKTTLQVLFLPIALLLLETFMLPFLDFVLNMSDDTKLLIGKLVLFGAAIGAILFIVGMFALGIGSVILAFGGIFFIIDKLIPDMSVLGVGMSSFIEMALGIAVVATVWRTLKDVAGSLMDKLLEVGIVKDLFNKLGIEIDDDKTAFENFKNLVSEGMQKVMDKLGLKGFDGESVSMKLAMLKIRFDRWIIGIQMELGKMGLDTTQEALGAIADILDTEMVAAIKKVSDILPPLVNKLAQLWKIWKDIRDSRLGGVIGKALDYRIDLPTPTPPISERPGGNLLPLLHSGAGINLFQTNNISAYTPEDIDRAINRNNETMVNDILMKVNATS